MLLSCWSRRMLSKVPHRPPLMFWQLAQRAWHPLGTEDRAAPKPILANLTCHERGDTDLGGYLRRERGLCNGRCCWCPIIDKLKARGLRNVDAANIMRHPCIIILNVNLLVMVKTVSTLSREPLRLTCVGTYFWRQRENLMRLAVMCFFLSASSCATHLGFILSQNSSM